MSLPVNRKRYSLAKLNNTQNIIHEKILRRDYESNIEKTSEKKLVAAKRVKNLKYKYTDGGVVGTAGAVTLGLIKHATLQLYSQYPSGKGSAHITFITDNSKQFHVQYTIRVSEKNDRAYTINLYHTTSKMLVNGRNIEKIMQDDLRDIHIRIEKALNNNNNPDIGNLNEMFIEQLSQLLKSFNSEKSKNTFSRIQQKT